MLILRTEEDYEPTPSDIIIEHYFGPILPDSAHDIYAYRARGFEGMWIQCRFDFTSDETLPIVGFHTVLVDQRALVLEEHRLIQQLTAGSGSSVDWWDIREHPWIAFTHFSVRSTGNGDAYAASDINLLVVRIDETTLRCYGYNFTRPMDEDELAQDAMTYRQRMRQRKAKPAPTKFN